MLREKEALIAEGQTDTAEDRIVSRRDGITKCGATEHDLGSRFGGRTTRAGAVLLPTPFDKFGHGRKLPCHKADAGLNGAWEGVHVAQWAKRPPLKLEVPGSSPRRGFNGHTGNRDPRAFRWLETARGLQHIRLIGRAQFFPAGLAASES